MSRSNNRQETRGTAATGAKRRASNGTRLICAAGGFLIAVGAISASVTQASAGSAKPGAFLSAQKAVQAPAGAREMCRTYQWACARSGRAQNLNAEHLKLAQSINRRVNRSVREITDQSQYRREEVWALPTGRGGDCEDFALLKKRLLVSAGIAPERLLITTVLDRRRNSHAVLVFRTNNGDYILDNLDDRILHWKETRYTFLRMQDPAAPARWIAVFAGGLLDENA